MIKPLLLASPEDAIQFRVWRMVHDTCDRVMCDSLVYWRTSNVESLVEAYIENADVDLGIDVDHFLEHFTTRLVPNAIKQCFIENLVGHDEFINTCPCVEDTSIVCNNDTSSTLDDIMSDLIVRESLTFDDIPYEVLLYAVEGWTRMYIIKTGRNDLDVDLRYYKNEFVKWFVRDIIKAL